MEGRDYVGLGDVQINAEDTSALPEGKTFAIRNSYVPSVLPEWRDACAPEKKSDGRSVRLTPENASSYAKTGSRVGWKGRIEHALGHIERDGELDEDLLARLLECVITTVIGLACGQVLPDECLNCSFLYLQQIKNEFGENPPNIAAFMEIIRSKLSQEGRGTLEKMAEADLASVPPNIVITRLPKSLQKRH